MKYANIVNSLVDFTTSNPNHFGKGIRARFVECPEEVAKGWHYDGVTFTPPTAVDLAKVEAADLRERRRDAGIDQLDKLMDIMEAKGQLTAEEVATVKAEGV